MLKDGDEVYVAGVKEVGEIVGKAGNDSYIVLWDKPVFDHIIHGQTEYRAMAISRSVIRRVEPK